MLVLLAGPCRRFDAAIFASLAFNADVRKVLNISKLRNSFSGSSNRCPLLLPVSLAPGQPDSALNVLIAMISTDRIVLGRLVTQLGPSGSSAPPPREECV